MRPDNSVPDVQILKRFLLGQLSAAEAEPVERYLEQLPDIASTLAELVKEDTLIGSLRASVGQSVTEAPELAELMDKLSQLRPASVSDATIDLGSGKSVAAVSGHDTFVGLAPPQSPDEIGRLGGYRVLKMLGAGGMGMVYQAEDVHLQRPIALKVMKAEVAKNPGNRERFLREARAAAKLKSDHVVHVYQVGEEREIVYLAMEFLEGLSLDDWLKKGRKATVAQAARIGRQIALGLADAHACGLIHRDIKPGNIWLDSRHQGRVKLLDFGLARGDKEDVQLTQSGAIVGTPAYMAPEQARGEKVDHRCDLFSLGVVLYRLTTGQMPFRGDNTMSLLTSLALDHPKPPREINADISPRMATLIERLLIKDREQRPATAKAVADELAVIEREATQPATDDRTVQIKQAASASARLPQPAPSRSRLRWLIAASLLFLFGGLAAGIVVIIRDKDGNKVAEINVPPGGSAEMKDKAESDKSPARLGALDELDPAKIPEEERIKGLPREVVAVLGTHRGWHRDGNHLQGLCVAYAPDGRRIATGIGQGGGIHLWDAENVRDLGRIPFDGHMAGIAFTPDGKTLMAASHMEIHFWDVSGAEPEEHLPALKSADWIQHFSCAPDGKTLACLLGDKHVVQLWDLTVDPPKVRAELPEAHNDTSPAFTPDGKSLAYSDGKTGILVWDVSVTPPKRLTVFRNEGGFFKIAFAPDGKTLAATDASHAVWLLDWNGIELKKRASWIAPVQSRCQSLKFSPQDKKFAVSCSRNYLVDWSGPQPQSIASLPYDLDSALAFSPDGKTLATFRPVDFYDGDLRLWDISGPKPRERSGRSGHVGSVNAVALSADDKMLVSGGERTVRLWRPSGGRFEQQAVLELPGRVYKLALSSDSVLLAVVGEGWLQLWDLSGLQPQRRARWGEGDIWAAAISPDGKTLAWSNGPHVHLSDLAQKKPVGKAILKGHNERVETLAFSPDGKTLASGGRDNTVRFWDMTQAEPSGRIALRYPPYVSDGDWVWDVAFTPDAKKLLVRWSGIGQVWDVTPAKPERRWEFTCVQGELCMVPARNNQSIFAFGSVGNREMLQCWFSSRDMRPWWVPGDHKCLAVATDGRHLVVGNANGTIYVLRMPPLTTAHPALEDAWLKQVDALELPEQIEAVAKKMKERNPDFDGELRHRIENGELMDVFLESKRIFDLAPLQVLRPRRLYLFTNPLTDLSPLRGMKLEFLNIGDSTFPDLSMLKGVSLKNLQVHGSYTKSMLAPLRSMETLQSINGKPAAEFWKEVDAKARN